MNVPQRLAICAALCAAAGPLPLGAAPTGNVHLTYHWHLHQPIYWPERNPNGAQTNRYQFAADSIALKVANAGNFYAGSAYKHPRNALVSGDGGEFDSVFDKADRVAAYQGGGRDSINTILGFPDGGASISYSGALQENIWSLGNANDGTGSYGYGPDWNSGYTQARGSSATYRTSGGFPRADMLGMTYHHAFSPLLPKSVLRKEIQIFKEIWWKSWGGNSDKSDHSKGFWPVECAFSETMIPVLVEEGYQWSIVANSHLARTCSNYLEVAQRGSSGWNIDPPNRADVLGPSVPANQWWSGTIDGRGGCFPAPYAYQAHLAKYVNPETGAESKLTIVPMCDLLSYENGFGTMGTGDIDAHIAPFNDTAHPSIVLMAHDGDNAWGGGNSYYQESVPDLYSAAAAKGYRPTTIQQFLADHPVPADDVVHIEDGAWVNAANDWGHPQFINWLWPPVRLSSDPAYNSQDPRTWFNITNGWAEDFRNWAVLIAGANYCETAEQITLATGGSVQAWKIQEPTSRAGVNNQPNAAEQAWHYYLGGLDSGFMYYGTSLDDEVKQTLAANRAISFATNVIGDGALDHTPPTMFKPQRFPWNPGGMGWGPLTGYKEVGFNGKPAWPSDFYIWTHIFDVSGVTNVTLFVRQDADGVNPIGDNANELYAGGPGVGAWVAIPMNRRVMPKNNFYNDPNISFFMEPIAIADEYWAQVAGYTNALLDYYVMAVDARGNTNKSDIQHVWVGAGDTSSGTSGSTVSLSPTNPVAGGSVTIRYDATGRDLASASAVYLHLGWNGWATVNAPDAAMTFNAASNWWEHTATIPANATQLDCVFNNGSGTWDNNGGADWHFAIAPDVNPTVPDQPQNLAATPVSTNRINLAWSVAGGAGLYFVNRDSAVIATTAATSYADTGLATGSAHCYFIIASNSVGASAASATVCADTLLAMTNLPGLVMDGTNDSAGYLLASSGMVLYGAVRGTTLYVATWSPGGSGPNDHFIFVSDQLLPAASAAAPWAKAGNIAVAASKPFLAGESQGSYVSWFANNAATNWPCAKSATDSGALEGTLDLAAAFGSVPANIYLCAAAYQTANGGALAAQCPAGSGSNIEANEFLALPTSALNDSWGNGTLDLCDPARGFKILSAEIQGTNRLLRFAVMPGRDYQVQFAASPSGTWTNLPFTNHPAPPQTSLSITDAPPPELPQGYYRVKLLP